MFKSQLLIVDARHPTSLIRQFEISAAVASEGIPKGTLFGWSPDGKTVLAAGQVIHPQNGTTCELPGASAPPYWPSALVGDGRLIQGGPDVPDGDAVKAWTDAMRESLKNDGARLPSSLPLGPPEPKSHFTFFNSDCQPQDKWEVGESWEISDVSTDRHLLAINWRARYEVLAVDVFASSRISVMATRTIRSVLFNGFVQVGMAPLIRLRPSC